MRLLYGLCALMLTGLGPAGCGLFAGAPPPAPGVAARADLLEPGDMVRVTVAGEEELSGVFTLGANGTVHLELLGDVPAAGLTAGMLAANLRARLAAGYLKEPQVTVARAGAPASPPAPAAGAAGLPPPPPLQGSLDEGRAAGPAAGASPPVLRHSQDVGRPY